MDVLSHPLSLEELRSLWLFYSSANPRDSAATVISLEDLGKLLQSIREQDTLKSDIPPTEQEYVLYIMSNYLKPSTKFKDVPILQWPEFSTTFNSYWVKRGDIYEQWRTMTSTAPTALPAQSSKHRGSLSSPIRPPIQPYSASSPRDDSASVRVLEAELVEVSERLRQARYQVEDEKQKRHQLRDDLDEARRQLDEERNRHRDVTKQLVIIEEDKLTHEIQVSRLREQIEQTISLKESLQLDLDRARMQLFHAKEKYETALQSTVADNEALRKKIDVLELEIRQSQAGKSHGQDMAELEAQNTVLRHVIDKYRRALPNSRFSDVVDGVSTTAFDAPKLAQSSGFLNALMEALDKAKYLNKQILIGSDPSNAWSKQSWQDLCVGWRETVCELCDLFATAHRLESAVASPSFST